MTIKPIKVSQLNNYIGRLVATDPLIGNVSVVGEISNLNFHNSGHTYFSLKDEKSTIRCFLPAGRNELRDVLEEGIEIVVGGYVSVYERGGYYSLTVKDLEVEGKGALAIAFEKIKKKLEEEGLFSSIHKKPLPKFPSKLALVTSETGAAVEDMLKILQTRNNLVDIIIYPVLVQGPQAPGEIADAIKHINSDFHDVELIIVGRGGGSTEDLWAFNEEEVARAIYASNIPIISAVGHEIDVTISDFVADRRAETPTAAAVMAVPDISQIRIYLDDLVSRSYDNLENLVYRNRQRLEILKARLDSLDPSRIIKSGYGAILDKDRKLVTSIEVLHEGEKLSIKLADGEINVTIDAITKAVK